MSQTSNLNFQRKELEKDEQRKHRGRKRREKFEVKIKINEMENRTTVEKMNKSKIYF